MAKGLDVGTSFIVLASGGDMPVSFTSDDQTDYVEYKEFRDAFYVISEGDVKVTKQVDGGKILFQS